MERYMIDQYSNAGSIDFTGAGGGTRTLTRYHPDRILSPARLPIPPLRQMFFNLQTFANLNVSI